MKQTDQNRIVPIPKALRAKLRARRRGALAILDHAKRIQAAPSLSRAEELAAIGEHERRVGITRITGGGLWTS